MKFFSTVDRFGTLIAVSLENIRAIECNDRENDVEDPYIRFTYTDNTSHHIKLATGKDAVLLFQRVVNILNKSEGVT